MAGFELEKWYLDAIDDRGRAAIGYAARLSWGTLGVGYASLLWTEPGRPTRNHSVVRGAALPRVDGSRTDWAVERLALESQHRALCPPLGAKLFCRGSSSVDWSCIAPRARVQLSFRKRRLRGLGYAERLRLGIAPWDLPIEELRWGRAINADCAVTWIDWRGTEYTRRLVAVDDACIDAEVDDEGVVAGAKRLVRFGARSIVRRGPLGGSVVTTLPRSLRTRLPKRLLEIEECKWIGEASVAGARGQAIWEVVRWPEVRDKRR